MDKPVDLQTEIDHQALILSTATSVQARRDAWELLRSLVASRPVPMVREMEIQRGLR